MSDKNKKIINFILLSAILLSALFLRVYKIDDIPAGIYPDEAVNGTDALLANETGDYKIFYTNNYGREGLFINLIAVSIKIFGSTILGLKFWSIVLGTLTVLGIYLLTRELFKSARAGLIAAFFLAFSFWAINFSRISFRAICVPFLLTFAFYFLFRGLRTKHLFNFVLAGLIFGLGFHTYIAFRIAPAILFVLLIAFVIARKNFLREYWKPIIIFSAAALITTSPMIYDFLKYPEHFESRSESISVFSPQVNQGHLLQTLAKSIGAGLIKYNFWGDQNWRHNYPPYPILNPIAGAAFLFGIIYLFAKTIHLFILRFKHKIYDDKLAIYTFLLSWFFIMLSPEFFTAEGLPHALRSIGTMPAVFIIAAIAFLWILGKAEKATPILKTALVTLITLTILIISVSEPVKYFVFWANNPNQHGAFTENYKNIALYLNSLPPSTNKYVLANGSGREMEDGLPVSAHVVEYLTYGKGEITYLKQNSVAVPKSPAVIALMSYDQKFIDRIESIFCRTRVKKIDLDPGHGADFTIISIK